MPESLVIIGAGRHGRIVAEAATLSGAYRVTAFVDGNPALVGGTLEGVPVVGDWRDAPADRYVVAIGDNRRREEVAEALLAAGRRLATVISPRATVSAQASVGDGTVILPGAIVQAGATVGRNVILNIGVLMDHDARVGDHANVAPGVILACFGEVTSREKVMSGTVRGGLPPAIR